MRQLVLALLAGLVLTGAIARADDFDNTVEPAGPQPALPTEQLSIIADDGKTHVFNVELAVTPQEQRTGLEYRTRIAANAGMLFPWPQPQISDMWMQNCPVAEDVVFIGADGTIAGIAENTVPYSLKGNASPVPVIATLELQGGITAALNISVGDKVIAKQISGG